MNEIKDMELEIKAIAEDGTFEGYASTFGNVDYYDDSIETGAFAKSISSNSPVLLWQHNREDVIGIFEELREDEKGLFVKGRLLKDSIQKATEAYALLKAHAIKGLSIGFIPTKYEYQKSSKARYGNEIRILKEVDLKEISLVTFPADTHAKVTGVKSIAEMGPREIEESLRDAGFSRKDAKNLISRCKELRETQSEETEILAAAKSLLNTISGGLKNGRGTEKDD